MRVLHVTPYYWPALEWGGPTRSVALLARATVAAGASVELYTTCTRGSSDLPPIHKGSVVDGRIAATYFRAFGPRRFFFSPQMTLAIARNVRRFDVVHLHALWTYPTVAAARACELARVPYVLSARGSLDPWALDRKSWKKRPYMALVERRTIRKAACIHFTAEDERAQAPAEFKTRESVVIPNCLETEKFTSLARAPRNDGCTEILILGRIHLEKGFDILIPALREVCQRGGNVRLVIAGPDEGGYAAVVARMVAEAGLGGCVTFAGPVGDAERAEAFRRADLLVAPSVRENFGMSIAEAMAAGLPVIVTDRVAISPIIGAAGAGIVVPRDVAALRDAILCLVNDPARRDAMGRCGRRLVLERYSMQAVGAAMLHAYEEVVSQRLAPAATT